MDNNEITKEEYYNYWYSEIKSPSIQRNEIESFWRVICNKLHIFCSFELKRRVVFCEPGLTPVDLGSFFKFGIL